MHKRLATILAVLVFAVAPARAQWTEPVRISEPGGCHYPQILAVGDTLHVVYSNNTGGTKISYVRSSDGGTTWSEYSVLSDTVNTNDTQFPRIMKYGSNLMVIWRAYFIHGVNRLNIGYSISTNNGLSWSDAAYILSPNLNHILYLSASNRGSVLNVIFSHAIGYDLYFYNVRSSDFGQSWSEPVEIFNAAQSSLTDQVNFNDNIHFSWAGRFLWEGVWETYYMKSTDNGINWTDNSMLSENDQIISQSPAICTDQSGHLACTWWDFKYSPYQTTGDVLIRQSYNNGENWNSEDQVTAEHKAVKSDVIWIGDSLMVVWEDWRFGLPTIYYVCSPDSMHDWSNKERLENDPEDSDNPAVAASNGKAYVVWADDRCNPDTDICGGIYFTRYDNEVGIKQEHGIILPYELSLDIYPNPFNSNVTISLKSTRGGEANLAIYDIRGRLVKTIFKGGNLEKGTHKFTWDATDAKGKEVSSGLYFAVAGTPQGKITKTLTLIR
jgi:hypothetical protein